MLRSIVSHPNIPISPEFPCLMRRSSDGAIFLVTGIDGKGFIAGTIIHHDKVDCIGNASTSFPGEDISVFSGVITLKNG